jgi:hypothetical protein
MGRLHRPRKRHMTEIVAEACGLVHADPGVRSVHIVGSRRPTYGEMRRYRNAAETDHVNLAIDRDGVVTVRPPRDERATT